jgi:hypothetical protein
MNRLALALIGALVLGLAPSAAARIVKFELQAIEPFANGASFGDNGPYVRVRGVAHGVLDPDDPQNAVIVNLDKAPRNADGLVEYDMDVFILRPGEPGAGNRKILYDVTNRGRKFLLHWLNDAPSTSPAAINDPKTLEDAGNGFVLREGYTIVWSGWDAGAPTGPDLMAIRVPVATDDGAPIIQRIRHEWAFGTRGPGDQAIAGLSYEAATLDPAEARLTMRAHRGDEPTGIPPEKWQYVDERTIRLLPAGTTFANGRTYEFWYPAKNPVVLGVGYAAVRDLNSFLRYQTVDDTGHVNPIALSGNSTGIDASSRSGSHRAAGRYATLSSSA